MEWIYLFIAILLEILGTTFMKISNGFTKILPSVGMILAYLFCFIFLSKALNKIPVSIAYAIWAAAGITIISIIGILVFKESITIIKAVSIAFIVIGVIGLNLSSIH